MQKSVTEFCGHPNHRDNNRGIHITCWTCNSITCTKQQLAYTKRVIFNDKNELFRSSLLLDFLYIIVEFLDTVQMYPFLIILFILCVLQHSFLTSKLF